MNIKMENDMAIMKKPLRLSETQKAILRHRLEVPDCLAEATDIDEDIVEDVCRLCMRCEPIDFARAIGKYGEAAKAVLADAVNGSTYWPRTESEDKPRRLANVERAGIALERKMSEYLGEVLEWPTW